MTDTDIAVIGAGIVGTSTALWARMRGHDVTLIDPEPPGSGTSSGNACTIATYACLPVNDPSVITGLPALLFGPQSPLAISWRHALLNPRWMLSFLANCRVARADRIAGHLATLLSHAEAGLNPLLAEAGAEDLVTARGQLSLWSTTAGAEGATRGLGMRRALGVPFTELTEEEARALEPGVALPIARAVHFTGARQVADPLALVQRFHARFTDLGGQTLVARATATRATGDTVEITTGGGTLTARHAVIACGAFSRSVRGSGAESLPLGCERGYHLLFPGEAHRVTRPTGWAEGGFYATPMAQGLRLAGTVEIAALNAPPNPKRLAYIRRRAAQMFPDLPEPGSSWLGHRPTLPDSLPAIGHSPVSRRIIHAFGHQHLGLTLGGITGRIVADLAEGRQPNLPLPAYDPARRFT
ncbi:FAD-dependent oxidoreductase [Pseudooceanicola sp. 216_PA32_1]|uniref:FAD-dependent oxidoreductase n=1 Tax=Pseudooceanicola pacificus TaxID=2676438 RepID=A0A844W4N9_9RHOB|nr:FAD-dependent oxidoreductase [Pseudooceanicola pacificus]MWB78807.1 FAD-dependent oxidoreductase [Pseudooceanicola pacificus]